VDRGAILDIVIKNLRSNVDGIERAEIDPARSMAEYGASSLDIVEVVSTSMREIGIGIPRVKLGQLRNIDDLVNLFHEVKNQA
jgi:polyketide biosynthesis acyl carrier protein